MHKRLDARFGYSGALISVMLAGCSAQAPSSPQAPMLGEKTSYQVQGGVGVGGLAMAQSSELGQVQGQLEQQPLHGALQPFGQQAEIPLNISVAQAPYLLHNLEYVTSHPILDYTWYYNRGNFATFGWAPGYSGVYSGFMYLNTGSYWAPYTMNAALGVYQPYSSVLGAQTYYPFIGPYGNPYYSLDIPYWGFGGIGGFGRGFTGRRRFSGRRGTGRRFAGRGFGGRMGGRGMGRR